MSKIDSGMPDHLVIDIPDSILQKFREVREIGPRTRKRLTRWLTPDIDCYETPCKLSKTLQAFCVHMFQLHNPWGVQWDKLDPNVYKILYKKDGYIRQHVDYDYRNVKHYKLTMVIVIERSKNCQGADWVIGENQHVEAPLGKAVIMPGIVQHLVTPVVTGHRETLGIWALGEAFK